jgi:hypothetical protein
MFPSLNFSLFAFAIKLVLIATLPFAKGWERGRQNEAVVANIQVTVGLIYDECPIQRRTGTIPVLF